MWGFFFSLALQSEKPLQDSFGLGGLYFFLYLSGESFLPFFPQHLPDTHNGESLKSLLSFHSCSPYPCLNKTQPGLNSGGHQALTASPPRPHRSARPANNNEPPGRGWEEGSLVPPLRLSPDFLPVSGERGSPQRILPAQNQTFHKKNKAKKRKKNPSRNVP